MEERRACVSGDVLTGDGIPIERAPNCMGAPIALLVLLGAQQNCG